MSLTPALTLPLAPKQESRLLLTLAGIQFTHILDFMIMMPLGPLLTRSFGLSTGQFGLLVSTYTFCAAIAAIAAATVIERFNRRRVVLVLYAGFIVATARQAKCCPKKPRTGGGDNKRTISCHQSKTSPPCSTKSLEKSTSAALTRWFG